MKQHAAGLAWRRWSPAILLQDARVTESPTAPPRPRRADWRGDRTPVMVRLPVPVAERLGEAAQSGRRSVSETAAALITAALSAERPA
jgi:hypothetical protein